LNRRHRFTARRRLIESLLRLILAVQAHLSGAGIQAVHHQSARWISIRCAANAGALNGRRRSVEHTQVPGNLLVLAPGGAALAACGATGVDPVARAGTGGR